MAAGCRPSPPATIPSPVFPTTFVSASSWLIRSRTGVHLGEVVRVEPELALYLPDRARRTDRHRRSHSQRVHSALAPSESWCGRTINSLCEPIDGLGPLENGIHRRSISNTAPPSMTRQRVTKGFKTGVRAIDIFSPLCLGQRLGIFAGSGVGKSTLLSMLARADAFDKVVIALVGERGREVREFIEDTLGEQHEEIGRRRRDQRRKPDAAQDGAAVGRHHRRAFPRPGRQRPSHRRQRDAFRPCDPRGRDRLRRAADRARLSGLGLHRNAAAPGTRRARARRAPASITAIISILVDGDNHNDPIADSTRGILDGHIVLAGQLAEEGRYPPINPLASVSRLARKAWRATREAGIGRLKALIHRFEETRDLRLIGGYRQGADPDLDMADQAGADDLRNSEADRPATGRR